MSETVQEHLQAAKEAENEYRYAEMARQAELALAAAEEAGAEKVEQALAHCLAGIALQATSNHSEACEHFHRGSELFDELGDNEHLIECELGLGECLIRLGELPRASHLIESASAKALALGLAHLDAKAQLSRGNISWMEGEYERAIKEIEDAIAAYVGLKDDYNEHCARSTLGVALTMAGRPDEAEASYMVALEYFQRLQDFTVVIRILHNLAGVVFFRQDYSRAREYLLQVLELEEETENYGDKVRSFFNLGLIELRTGNLKTASKYFNRALVTAQDVGDRISEGAALLHLGIICLLESNPQEALNYAFLGLGRFEGSASTFAASAQAFLPIFHLAANHLEIASELWEGSTAFQEQFDVELAYGVLMHLDSPKYQPEVPLSSDALEMAQTWLQQLAPEKS